MFDISLLLARCCACVVHAVLPFSLSPSFYEFDLECLNLLTNYIQKVLYIVACVQQSKCNNINWCYLGELNCDFCF